MDTKRTLVSLLALAALAAPARADEVVLDNGSVLVGRVLSDDGKELKIELASGTMTFERSRIRSVKKAPLPAPKAAAGTEKPAARDGGAKTPEPKKPAPSTGTPSTGTDRPYPRTAEAQLAELEATQLRPWSDDESRGCEDGVDPSKPWKVKTADGRVEYRETAPASDAGLAQVWVMERQSAGGYAFTKNGAPMMQWSPSYWNPERGQWLRLSPALLEFQRYDAIAKSLLGRICGKDINAWVECASLVDAMGHKQGGSRIRKTEVSIADELTKLRDAAGRACGVPSAGPDAARCLEIEHEMKWESPSGKIRLARERTSILRRLLAAVPPSGR